MTASLRGLIALTALAVALGVAVVIDRPRAAVVTTSRLFPGFEPDEVTRVTLGHVVIVRDGDTWQVEGDAGGPADPIVVADVLGALELASAERWVSGGAFTRTVIAEAGSARHTLELGEATPAGQVWARAGGKTALIAGWVARALDRDAPALRRRAVITTARPTGVELHAGGVDLVTSGDPAVAHLGVGNVRLAPRHARALADALAALRLVEFPAGAPDVVGTLRVLGGNEIAELEDRGPCPGGRRWIGGTAGSGCVDGWDAVIAAATEILDDVTRAVDPSPLAEPEVARIVRGDAVVERRGGGWTLAIGGEDRPPDDDAIDALVDALRAPARVVPLAGDPATTTTITVTHAGGAEERLAVVDSVAGPALRRDAEPFALVVDAAALAALVAGFEDRTLVAEDWTKLSRVLIQDGARATDSTRGATLESWSASPAVVTAIRDLLIDLRADALGGATVDAPARTILVHYEAPPVAGGEPVDHELRLAPRTKDGRCRVTVDGATSATLAPADCAILLAPI